jgi:SAM-dependent methyltransferase
MAVRPKPLAETLATGLDSWSLGEVQAAYDEIADWYEQEFLPRGDPLGLQRVLRELLGEGQGPCLEIGCGTGVHAALVRELGWTPAGVDLSAGMLRHARGRLPAVLGDAGRLPVRDTRLPAVIAMMAHTDMPGYPAVLREVARVLRPGGMFVHVGVHPCFCGGFADRTDPEKVLVRPGYLDGHWTKRSWTDQGVRDKVGAGPAARVPGGGAGAGAVRRDRRIRAGRAGDQGAQTSAVEPLEPGPPGGALVSGVAEQVVGCDHRAAHALQEPVEGVAGAHP